MVSAGGPASPEALQQQLQSLRLLFVAALMAILLFSVGVNIYLFRQVSMVRKELDATNGFLDEYNKKDPLLSQFIVQLQTYAQTHPDFNPVLEKYNLKPSAPGQLSPPPATGKTGK